MTKPLDDKAPDYPSLVYSAEDDPDRVDTTEEAPKDPMVEVLEHTNTLAESLETLSGGVLLLGETVEEFFTDVLESNSKTQDKLDQIIENQHDQELDQLLSKISKPEPEPPIIIVVGSEDELDELDDILDYPDYP